MARGISVVLSNGCQWPTQAAAKEYFKEMLHRYGNGQEITNRQDHDALVALLERYDDCIAEEPTKTGKGIDGFFRRLNVGEGYSTPGFWVRRIDGSETDFSYISAVKGTPKGRSLEFNDACRATVQPDLLAAKRDLFERCADSTRCVPCELTGVPVTFEEAHLDHAWPSFGQVVAAFRAARGWTHAVPDAVLTPPADSQTITRFADPEVAKAFVDMHHGTVILRLVHKKANLAKAARERRPVIRNPVKLP